MLVLAEFKKKTQSFRSRSQRFFLVVMALFSMSFFPASPVVVPRVAQCRRSHRYIYVDYSRLIVRHSVFIVFSLYFWFDTSCDPCKVKLYFLVTDNYLINTNSSLTLTHVGIKPCPRSCDTRFGIHR